MSNYTKQLKVSKEELCEALEWFDTRFPSATKENRDTFIKCISN